MPFTEYDLLGLTPTQRRHRRLMNAKEKGRHTKKEWEALKKFFLYRCLECGWLEGTQMSLTDPRYYLAKDHVFSIMAGGCDCIGNIQPLCNACNIRKGRKEYQDFRYQRIQEWGL